MPGEFAIGDRVLLVGSHSRAGQTGQIVNSPGTAFNGWGVRLDNGLYTGAGDEQMRKEESDGR